MLTFIYNFFFHIFALLALPKMFYSMGVKGKYRTNFFLRWGIGFPIIEKKNRFTIWIHAVSVGETKAVAPLVKRLRERYPKALIIFSSITETGHGEAKRSLPEVDHYLYLPFDLPYIIKPIVSKISPDLLIITETDFWYNFQRYAKAGGARIVLVNGKISEKSQKRMEKFPSYCKGLWQQIDRFCLQNELYRKRFEALGVSQNKITVTGNIKLDADFPNLSEEERLEWKKKLGIAEGDEVIVVGSTHSPEEELILSQLTQVWKKHPSLKVILAPRHPERAAEVEKILNRAGCSMIKYSEIEKVSGYEQVILVDGVGLLRQCYQLATLALVAGSYTPKVGGHNILEPAGYGVPVLFGPHMHSQPGFVEMVQESKAGQQVASHDLGALILRLLDAPLEREAMGKAAYAMIHSAKGATLRTEDVLSYYQPPGSQV